MSISQTADRFTALPDEKTLAATVVALEEHGFSVEVVDDLAAARQAVLTRIPHGATVMTNTSETLNVTGIADAINDGGPYQSARNEMFALDFATQAQQMKAISGQPDYALGSAHAVTQDGTLVIASASGSQFASMAWGAANVIFVVGTQKIVPDLAAAHERIYQHSLVLEDARAQAAYGQHSFVGKILEIHQELPGRVHVVLIKEPAATKVAFMVPGPVLVALPGTMCTPAVFGPLTRELAGEVTVDPVSWLTEPGPWDIPSIAERVADHIDRRWHRPVLVCGHSTGGAIALQLTIRHPDAVAGLVLVDTGAHMRGHGDVDATLERIRAGWGEELRAAVLDRSFLVPLAPEVRAEFLAWAAAVDQQAVYDVLTSQRELDLTGELAAVTQPAVVIHGRHDRARPPAQGRELAASLPDAEFRLIEDAGHTPVYETPEVVAGAVRDVLARSRS